MDSDCLLSAAAITTQATLQSGDWLCLGSALLSVGHFIFLRFNFFLCNTKKWTPWFLRRPAPSPPLVAGPHMFCTQWLSECFFPHRCWQRDELLCGVCSQWPCPLLSGATCSSGKWDPFPALPLPTVPSPLLPRFCFLISPRQKQLGTQLHGWNELWVFWRGYIVRLSVVLSPYKVKHPRLIDLLKDFCVAENMTQTWVTVKARWFFTAQFIWWRFFTHWGTLDLFLA